MKPAREPASSRPKPCASLKKPHESCPFAAPCGPRRKKNARGQTSASPSETSRFTPKFLAHRGSALPWFVDQVLPGSSRQCSLPLACRHPPEGHQIGARKGRTPGNTILSQPYRRRVSTDRPNREGSQLAAARLDYILTRQADRRFIRCVNVRRPPLRGTRIGSQSRVRESPHLAQVRTKPEEDVQY